MSQVSDFDAQVRSELLARRSNLGWCIACGGAVLLEENFMRVEGRIAHANCRHETGPGDRDIPLRPAPGRSAPARAPRAPIALGCTLRRRNGPPIPAETIDLGPDGMRLKAHRPLADDETIDFEIPNLNVRVAGLARVMRQQRPHIYSLRFERLPGPMYRCLHALARRAARPYAQAAAPVGPSGRPQARSGAGWGVES